MGPVQLAGYMPVDFEMKLHWTTLGSMSVRIKTAVGVSCAFILGLRIFYNRIPAKARWRRKLEPSKIISCAGFSKLQRTIYFTKDLNFKFDPNLVSHAVNIFCAAKLVNGHEFMTCVEKFCYKLWALGTKTRLIEMEMVSLSTLE